MTMRELPAAGPLLESDLDPDPFRQFRSWFEHALASSLTLPEAMTLATVSTSGRPSARMVLLRGFDERGLVFFTNYESRKGRELSANPWAALLLYWAELERQIRMEGRVEMVSTEESDAYFDSRQRGSQLSAWASQQSEAVTSRDVLEERMRQLALAYEDGSIPRPAYWGGYRVVPTSFEFWQGRPDRLHDRCQYLRTESGTWLIQRLQP